MPLHPKLLDHFQNPRNTGTLATPPAIVIGVSNPACGDTLRLFVELDSKGTIAQVRYQVRGCTASIAAGSALTVLMQGLSKAQLATLRAQDIEAELGELEPASKHAAVLCEDAVQHLLL